MNKINDAKCAPGVKYEDGSCFKKQSLIEMIELYNSKNKSNKIDFDMNQDKEYYVEKLDEVFNSKCLDQLCWVNQIKLNGIRKEELLKQTFRPFGPDGKLDWLSTTDITDVLEQYQNVHKDFLYLGTVPYDFEEISVLNIRNINFEELQNEGKNKIAMVINLDESHQSGSHWVALYTDLNKNQIYFFDSVGKKPGMKIRNFINKIAKYIYKKKYNKVLHINKVIKSYKSGNLNEYLQNLLKFDIKYNHIQHQLKNTECGVYSSKFIIELLEGKTFHKFITDITRDDETNEYRKKIFINVN